MARTVTLDHPADWPGFRAAARSCLQAGLEPAQVHWQVAGAAEADLFGGMEDTADHGVKEAAPPYDGKACHGPGPTQGDESGGDEDRPALQAGSTMVAPEATTLPMPRAFIALCAHAALHRESDRFALLYRALWRMAHEPALRHDPLDPDIARLHRMAAAVRRDIHKMRAFVRFRPVQDGGIEPLHVAWFEPDHFIVQANAAFFVQRFTQMRWAILTPECSLRWDGQAMQVGPGAQRADAPGPDAGEALWLTYYRHTFNPARLKLDMMRREMPTRYWKNLPEAALIGELAHGAAERSGRMVEAPGTVTRRRLAERSGGG